MGADTLSDVLRTVWLTGAVFFHVDAAAPWVAALVTNVVIVAVLSTPTVRYFGDDQLNTWVTYTPFVWLPAVLVLAAFAGHLLIFRALRLNASTAPTRARV